MLRSFKLIIFSVSIVVSTITVDAESSVRKLTNSDKSGILQVAKSLAKYDKSIYSHTEFNTAWNDATKSYQTYSRSVYRPMTQKEIDEEIECTKAKILNNINLGIDIFVFTDEQADLFYGYIFADPRARSSNIVEYTKVYISPAGAINFNATLYTMILFVEHHYKNLSFAGVALKSEVAHSSFFLKSGYLQFSEKEALEKGFYGQSSAKNNILIAAALVGLAGLVSFEQSNASNYLLSTVFGGCSFLSALYMIGSFIDYRNNIVYFKRF